jgi:SAM-dependent methyltransferase
MKSTDSLFAAAIESASIFSHAVRECAESSGLLALLQRPRTIEEIIGRMRFHPDRREALENLLAALAAEDVVEKRVDRDNRVAYARRVDGAGDVQLARPADGRYLPRHGEIADWFGEAHTELIRSANKAFFGRDLGFFRTPDAAIRFNKEYESAWRTNLQNPLYEFGRLRCVRELVRRGNRFLDLACGPGFGIRRLAEFSTEPCTILAVDKSLDFLDIARSCTYPSAKVSFVHRDLNLGLPMVPAGAVDGILFNGAFHFIADKHARLREMRAALRPGGLLAIGHCFSISGFADEAMHSFYFSLMDDRAWPVSWGSLKAAVAAAGLGLIEEFHRGSHSYLLAERLRDDPSGWIPAP